MNEIAALLFSAYAFLFLFNRHSVLDSGGVLCENTKDGGEMREKNVPARIHRRSARCPAEPNRFTPLFAFR